MQDHENPNRKGFGKPGEKRAQGLGATSGNANDDDSNLRSLPGRNSWLRFSSPLRRQQRVDRDVGGGFYFLDQFLANAEESVRAGGGGFWNEVHGAGGEGIDGLRSFAAGDTEEEDGPGPPQHLLA